jgi:hypothetical protein
LHGGWAFRHVYVKSPVGSERLAEWLPISALLSTASR